MKTFLSSNNSKRMKMWPTRSMKKQALKMWWSSQLMKSSLCEVVSVITVRSKSTEKGILPTKSNMNVPYVEKDSAEEHLRAIRSKIIITVDIVDSNGKVKCMFHQSCSQYGGIRSAINHVYIVERVQIPERMKKGQSIFIAGMERTLIAEKQMLGLKFYEGKNHQPQGICAPCKDTIWKRRKEGYFCTSIHSFRLVPHENIRKLCQRQNKSHSFSRWLPCLWVQKV